MTWSPSSTAQLVVDGQPSFEAARLERELVLSLSPASVATSEMQRGIAVPVPHGLVAMQIDVSSTTLAATSRAPDKFTTSLNFDVLTLGLRNLIVGRGNGTRTP